MCKCLDCRMPFVCTFGGYRWLHTAWHCGVLYGCCRVTVGQSDHAYKQLELAWIALLPPLGKCIGLDVDVLWLGVTHSRHSNFKLSGTATWARWKWQTSAEVNAAVGLLCQDHCHWNLSQEMEFFGGESVIGKGYESTTGEDIYRMEIFIIAQISGYQEQKNSRRTKVALHFFHSGNYSLTANTFSPYQLLTEACNYFTGSIILIQMW